ncbi:transcription termination/antitermination protein NusA [Limisphaera ngatamarikiensis]|uniref:Transcription termination/antitermination protein NusA n=1 Tax=Limisphaera ngatamarikiensis TaxID=1324935 RepID=A0A6M1S286_9BACT|nr:transcription termination factor NusA [Limisphaera ngatamarikiensis]NGO39490.1 transcription termination/antitermination protein NusA [Limisphaera ngatamarikiensis]
MNADLLALLDYFEREKGISRERMLAVVHDTLLSAAKKAVGPARQLRVEIDPKSGEIRAYARLIVAQRVASKHDQISLAEAQKLKPGAQVGDEVEVEVTPTDFGRIAAQYAKQWILQNIRKIEKEQIYAEFKDRVGDIVSGTVRRFERSDVILDLGRYEAVLPNRERVPTEEYQVGDHIRAFVKAVEQGPQGPEIILSRADPRFVVKLFELEVSEIRDRTVEIKGIAREPGYRTKLAVHSRDEKVDPVGACVGLRGQRVKNIVRELNNERVDVIRWSPDIRVFVANALAPAKIKAFEVDEARRRIKVITTEDQLSLAIGKRGQNARLTAKLTGWQVDIEAEATVVKGFEEKVAEAVEALAAIPGISREQADILVHHGLTRLEDLLQVEESDLQEIPELADQAAAILEAARAEAQRRTIPLGQNAQPGGAAGT